MRVAVTLPPITELADVARLARRAEAWGVDTLHIPEMTHDSLMVAALAAQATSHIGIRTSMTLAFPRSPMVVAYAAWDLARLSNGRFELGLASQVRGNIVGRFGIEWTDDVAARLADYVTTVRAIFDAFARGGGIDHHGSHYTITRLQPAFTPAPLDCPPPSICLGAVGPGMARAAGEVADRIVTHATNTHPRYLADVLLPAIERGATAAGRPRPPVTVVPMCITAPDVSGLIAARERARRELGFLYSTPRYHRTLELLDLGWVGQRLSAMAQQGDWQALGSVLTDEVLARIIPQAQWQELPDTLHSWFAGVSDQVSLAWPEQEEGFSELVARMHAR